MATTGCLEKGLKHPFHLLGPKIIQVQSGDTKSEGRGYVMCRTFCLDGDGST